MKPADPGRVVCKNDGLEAGAGDSGTSGPREREEALWWWWQDAMPVCERLDRALTWCERERKHALWTAAHIWPPRCPRRLDGTRHGG